MSGGHFNYSSDHACNEIFDWCLSADYGLADDDMKIRSAMARKFNPLEDKIISELVYDVFCLIHSYDWYACCDTGEDTYRKDVKYFKEKWLKQMDGERAKEIIDTEIDQLRSELYRTFNVEESDVRP